MKSKKINIEVKKWLQKVAEDSFAKYRPDLCDKCHEEGKDICFHKIDIS